MGPTPTPVVSPPVTPVTHAPNPPRKPKPSNRSPTKAPVLMTPLVTCNGITSQAIVPPTSVSGALASGDASASFPNCPSTVATGTVSNSGSKTSRLFSVLGTGSMITATTCFSATSLDTQLSVYEFSEGGACPGDCVAADDNDPSRQEHFDVAIQKGPVVYHLVEYRFWPRII